MADQKPDSRQLRYQRLLDIAVELATNVDLNDLLCQIVQAAIDLTEAESAAILLYQEDKNQLIFQTSTDSAQPVLQGIKVPVDESIAGWITKNRKPVIVHNPQEDPRFYSLVQKQTNQTTKSLLGVPLIAKEEVIGVLETINKQDGSFNNEDQDILMTLAAQAAIAIMNARLFIQSDLISEMVHELRTPLASLNAATHLLLRPDTTPEQDRKMVHIIQSETTRLSELATSFLDLARLESGQSRFHRQPLDLTELLDECIHILQGQMLEKRIELIKNVPGKFPKFYGDRDKLKQVFLNLLNNAIKYNIPGGQIGIKAFVGKKEFSFAITDTGPGIPEESIERLFEKFYRVPGTENMAQGTGLGLSIVKNILASHGGDIQVQSVHGSGTTFTVLLPKEPLPPPTHLT